MLTENTIRKCYIIKSKKCLLIFENIKKCKLFKLKTANRIHIFANKCRRIRQLLLIKKKKKADFSSGIFW